VSWRLREVKTKSIELDFVFGVRRVSRSGDRLWQMIDRSSGKALQTGEGRLTAWEGSRRRAGSRIIGGYRK
jgi:hypothetical protein